MAFEKKKKKKRGDKEIGPWDTQCQRIWKKKKSRNVTIYLYNFLYNYTQWDFFLKGAY